jgi:hypothetical protein
MKYTAYRCPKGRDVWDAIVAGFGARDVPVSQALQNGPLDRDSVAIIGGLDFGSDVLLRECRRSGHPYVFVDSGYMAVRDRDNRRIRYRVVPNAYAQHWLVPCGPERYEALGLEMAGWRAAERRGRTVLLCASSAKHAEFFGSDFWMRDRVRELGGTRPARLREKDCKRPFAEDLAEAWAVVTWSSNVAVEAVLAGVPVITGPECAAWPMSSGGGQSIEDLLTPPRALWAASLAHGQFTVDEIASGMAREHSERADLYRKGLEPHDPAGAPQRVGVAAGGAPAC